MPMCYDKQIQLFSAFWLQFIQQAIRRDFSNIDEILTPPEGQDEGVWKYEHLRYLSHHSGSLWPLD